MGRVAGPFESIPFPTFRVSPVGLLPKKDGDVRLIHHLSNLRMTLLTIILTQTFAQLNTAILTNCINDSKSWSGCIIGKN